jgi:antitoxin VapB
MIPERHVKFFRNGGNQAVQIPREFEFWGDDAIMRKEGEKLIIESAPLKSLPTVLAILAPPDEEFPAITDPNAESAREARSEGDINLHSVPKPDFRAYLLGGPKVEECVVERCRATGRSAEL